MLDVRLEAYGLGGMWKRYFVVDIVENELVRVSITKFGLQEFLEENGMNGYAFFETYKEALEYMEGDEK